jgi:GNAT superfamily N-acetyltransferase
MTDSFAVVTDHPSLITFIDGLQRKNAEALSFYPRCVFERESEKHRLFLGLLNGQPCGYIYVGAKGVNVRCHQVCIEYDARRRLYGAMLVVAMEQYAAEGKASTITLRCGADLDANQFWLSLGYSCVAIRDGGVRRMRKINVWQKELSPGLFLIEHIEPSVQKTSAEFWRKHKQTGIVTQFARGNSMKKYRLLLEEGAK